MNKCELQYIEQVNNNLLFHKDDIYTYDYNENIIRSSSKTYNLSLNHELKCVYVKAFIDKTSVIAISKNICKLIDIKTLQIIKQINLIVSNLKMEYCASSDKYLVFKRFDSILIFDVMPSQLSISSHPGEESNDEPIRVITPPIKPSREIAIVNDVIYITCNSVPLIFKYKISDTDIDKIIIKNIEYNHWIRCRVTITNTEIVIISGDNVLFYDLDGVWIGSSTINHYSSGSPFVTSNYIYVINGRVLHKYKRNFKN
jgi:hypothetical protein